MMQSRSGTLFRGAVALSLLPLLSGCFAALAVPLLSAGGILAKAARSRAEIVSALPAANRAEAAGETVQLTALTDLPPPSGGLPAEAGPWRDFTDYTLAQAARLASGAAAPSALLAPGSASTFRPRTRTCGTREAAVVIDLDPPERPFDPADAASPAPDVAATAAELRAAGVIVLWLSQADANGIAAIADALKRSGLDPTGRDPILLVRHGGERKQVLREEANEVVCVVAVAGDERSDFDELFDYLRDPRLATAFDAQLGAGWFLVPPLSQAETPPSAIAPAGEDGGR